MFSTNIFHWKLKLNKKGSNKGVKRRRSNSAESAEAARDNKRRFSVLPFISNIKFNLNELVELPVDPRTKESSSEQAQQTNPETEQMNYHPTEVNSFRTYSESPTGIYYYCAIPTRTVATLDDLPVLDFLSAEFPLSESSASNSIDGTHRILAKCASNDETTAREWDLDLRKNYSLNTIEQEILALENGASDMLCI